MASDEIEEVGIDGRGWLFIKPKSKTFPMMYREAIEIHWDEPGQYLFAPELPRSELKTPFGGSARSSSQHAHRGASSR
jgi:hypothetical protein